MHRDAAKAHERRILESVYDPARLVEILPSERPDFLLRNHGEELFGAEVTELFETESHREATSDPFVFE